MSEERTRRRINALTTPRAAGLAGVLFAILFAAALILIRTSSPDGAQTGAAWRDGAVTQLKVASILMPFAGIFFLWFLGVVRDGIGRHEDRFFATVFIGSGLLFLAMVFAASAVGAALVASRELTGGAIDPDATAFGHALLVTLTKTYALRMGATFMISLATIWLKTRLMPMWLIGTTYALAVTLLIAADTTMWLTLAFPCWVLLVSLLALARAGIIDLHLHDERPPDA